jgi:hypothetical protein
MGGVFMLTLSDFKTEYRIHPVGLDCRFPRFSWKLHSDLKDTVQESAYIWVTDYDGHTVWDSGCISSDESACLVYAGDALSPRVRYTVRVRVRDNHGQEAETEDYFETGLFSGNNIRANWITHGFEDGLVPPAVFSRCVILKEKPKVARIYSSALGIYHFTVNGKEGSDCRFAPGWTSYETRIQYQTADVTNLLREGENRLVFTVANGWYKGILGFENQGNHYGTRTGLIAELFVRYEDGEEESFGTDENWMSGTGPIRSSEIYHGETVDLTADCRATTSVRLLEKPSTEILTGQEDAPVRVTEEIPAKRFLKSPAGENILDFGQNLTGVVRFRTRQKKGTKIVIRHGEALDENGNLYTMNLRTARAEDTFVCDGKEDVFCPLFTFHGFRYIAVDGLQEPDPSDFTALVIGTDLAKTGEFTCSDQRVNRLMKNIDWGLRDNFLDIPTDCPQRDERLGYTGDAELFLPTACRMRDVRMFFEKWLKDLVIEQKKGQGVPMTVPNILGPTGGISIWQDAAVMVPWTLYQEYGDSRILEEQYESMKDCVNYDRDVMCGENGLISKGQQLGDWVSMDIERGPLRKRKEKVWNLDLSEKIGATNPFFIANAFYYRSVNTVAMTADILGRKNDAEVYHALAENILSSVRSEFITPAGRVSGETQTGEAIALTFGIAEEKDRKRITSDLAANISRHKNHLTTGFAGTAFLLPALSENGRHDVAGKVFLQDTCPSWLYSVGLGATTIWELWDGVNEDGSFWPFEMNSLNHYALGSVGEWVYRYLLGISPLMPGYKKIRIAPRLIYGIIRIQGGIETPYGRAAVKLSCSNGKYDAEIIIPENTDAVISLPGKEDMSLGSGTYRFSYDTQDTFEKKKFDSDSKFGSLLRDPQGRAMFEKLAPELLSNNGFLLYAENRSVQEVTDMMPPEAKQLIDFIVDKCNKK